MTTTLTPAAPFFPQEHRDRIINHMNEDHADAVLHYARHFGKRTAATAATLAGLDQDGIDLVVTEPQGSVPVRVAFEPRLEKPEDAHHALIRMAKAGRESAPAAGAGDAAKLQRAKDAVAQLKAHVKTILLGTASSEGEPDCSVAPWTGLDGGVILTYVSELSPHTQNMRGSGKASVLLIEDEASAAHLLARRRLTLRCAAQFLDRGGPEFAPAMAAMKEKYGPVMQHLESMTDFHLVRLTPQSARLVAGFGQAYDADPAAWDQLQHVGGGGHGHSSEAKKG
jgi:putative heme iron utilization protein